MRVISRGEDADSKCELVRQERAIEENGRLTPSHSPFKLLRQQHTSSLIQPEHDIHVLNSNSAGPLDQIINCRKDH